jgi:hypothetical protein
LLLVGSSSSSLDEQPSLSSPSSAEALAPFVASSVIYLRRFLLSSNFLTSHIAFKTHSPTFSKSPYEKCFPESAPRLAPANDASKVKTKGILSL